MKGLIPFAIGAAAIIGACTQVDSNPSAVVALAFDSLPYPAVVALDTLRDESGAAVPLRASPLNSDGVLVPDAVVQFVALDPGIEITSDGFVVSTSATVASARIVAQIAGLQSRTLQVTVTARPDSVVQDGTVDTLRYETIDVSGNTSSPITVRVLSTSAEPPVPVNGWIVRYSVEHHGTPLSPADATLAWLVDESGRRSSEDTTGTDGRASRRLRVNPSGLVTADDSLVVIATATARGAPLAGSPIRAVVQVRPQ